MFLDPAPIYDLARRAMPSMAAIRLPTPEPDAPRSDADRGHPADPLNRSGVSCGYNSQWTAKASDPARNLIIGYADGLPARGRRDRRQTGRRRRDRRTQGALGRARVDGPRLVDVTDVPEDQVRVGDPVELFGRSIDLDDFALAAARSATTC